MSEGNDAIARLRVVRCDSAFGVSPKFEAEEATRND